MDIFSNPNFNILPLTVDLGLKDESPFIYSKNGLSFVIKKRFMSDIENRDDYRCSLLKIEILEGDVADINPFVAPPIMVYSVSKNEYYTFTLSNIHQSTENVVLTFNFSFNYKEQRIVSEMVYITVPVAKTKMLKFGEYICDTICFPQYNKLTFESYWTKNMLNNGKAVCRFIVKNKKGVIINGIKTDFYINFEECYLDNYFFQPYEINFTIDLDEVQKKLQMPKLPNFSNPKKLDGHLFNNPHLPKPKLSCQNPISKQIPSNSSLLGQQNLQNNSSQKTTSISSTPFLLKLLQAPPQKKLTSSSFKKNKYKSLQSTANKERTENEIENITCLQESLMKINSSDSLSVSSKTIDTFKDTESPKIIIDSEHFKENVYGASKTEDLLKKLYLISSSDNLCDSDFSESSIPRIFNMPFDEATVEMLQQDTPFNDLSISKTFKIQNLLPNSVDCTKCGSEEIITEKNDIQLNSQKYCTGSDVETETNELSKIILSTLKHIEPKYLEKEYVFQAEEITTKQFPEIQFVDSNDEDSKTLIKFITSDGIEIEENAEILCNVSPIFKAVFDSSDKNDCKIDTKFNPETIHHALNYLRENDEKLIKGHEKELYKFASEYVIESLKENCIKMIAEFKYNI
uniref:BTB domain-containing protein n=1 Tax=Panagrolaimus sp. PS1159 TaxID=55785 RepID=A0AC35F147_9BILA